ncbi:MAG: hypothetical protein HY075_08520 [Deltaproteobacteria bacterium]|nr:hypothetical protein [Deltaproteobacteria bacterium]
MSAITSKSVLFAVVALVVSANAFAGPICDRSLTYDKLTAAEKALVDAHKQAARFVPQANGYYIGYIFSLAKFDTELAFGVYTSCGEHAGKSGLGDFLVQSKITSDESKNPFRVFYEQQVSFPYDNGQYTVENTIGEEQGGYILNTKLIESSDAGFSPKFADGYVRMTPKDGETFVIACNYMIPRTGSFKGTFNDLAKERLQASGKNLLAWVTRVSGKSASVEFYKNRLKRILGK